MLTLPPAAVSLLSFFAKPLGSVIATGLATASTAFVTWSVSKGVDQGTATTVAAGVVGAVGALAQWFASTQGVNIAVINSDPTNGARVVEADKAKSAGIPKLDPSSPKA